MKKTLLILTAMLFVGFTAPAFSAETVSTMTMTADEKLQAEKIIMELHNYNNEKMKEGYGPFVAAIYDKNGNLVAKTANTVVKDKCPLHHAEMNCIKAACEKLGTYDLSNKGLKMYVTAEPCVMCAGGIMWSGIDTVYYSVNSKDVQKLTGFDEGYKPLLWKAQFKKRGINLYGGIEESAGRASLDKYVLDGHKVYKPERQDNND